MPIWGGTSCTTATTTSTTNYIVWVTATTSASTAPIYYSNRPVYTSAYDDPAARQASVTRSHNEEAKKRALDLLIEHLTPEQKKTFEEKKWFVVEGGKSKTQYRIRAKDDLIANIDVVDGEKTKHRLCGHCSPSKVVVGEPTK
jgi:hypothetical protein